MQSYVSNVFMTGIMSEWAMSTIEAKLATRRVPSSVRAWIESSTQGEEKKSQNLINVQLAREKSKIVHRSSNIPHPGENVACAQPRVSHQEEEIKNSNFNMSRASVQVKSLMRMIENQQQKELKITEVCYLLEVSWQVCHAWITHWTVARAVLTMSRRRSTRDERTHGRDAREPLLARTRAYLAPREPAFGS